MTLSSTDFEFISSLVRKEAAIVLDKGKEYLVEARIGPLTREFQVESIADLVSLLRSTPPPDLTRRVVEALTTNETSFFRDIEPFEALRTTIIPEVLERRAANKKLTIWCAASSTGQEPYSIAMQLREYFPVLQNWQVRIIATDICRQVLDRARKGIYTQLEVNRGLPAIFLVKYFQKQGMEWHLKEDIRKMVQFEELNLIKPTLLLTDIDIVFIRNVLIYFDLDVKRDILGRIRKVMRSDGVLFLGAAETTLNVDDNFERRALGKASCYCIKK